MEEKWINKSVIIQGVVHRMARKQKHIRPFHDQTIADLSKIKAPRLRRAYQEPPQ